MAEVPPELRSFQDFVVAVYAQAQQSAQVWRGTLTVADLTHAVTQLSDNHKAYLNQFKQGSGKIPDVAQMLLKLREEKNPTVMVREIAQTYLRASAEARAQLNPEKRTISELNRFGKAFQSMPEAALFDHATRKAMTIASKRFEKEELRSFTGQKKTASHESFSDILLRLSTAFKECTETFLLRVSGLPYKKREKLILEWTGLVSSTDAIVKESTVKKELSSDQCERLQRLFNRMYLQIGAIPDRRLRDEMRRLVFSLFTTLNSLLRVTGASLL